MTNYLGIDQDEKLTPVGDDRIIQTDSANSNTTVWSTLTNLATSIFGLKTTTDLDEGDKLYYTDTRVDENSTVVGLGNTKADKTNVLELDNTTVYTPTLDYHPATIKYVNDNMSIPDATTLVRGLSLIATDAEALVGTNETKSINPKQAKANVKPYIVYNSVTSGTEGPQTITLTHGLGRTPVLIKMRCSYNTTSTGQEVGYCNGFYDTTNYGCVGIGGQNDGSGALQTQSSTEIALLRVSAQGGTAINVVLKVTISSVTSTELSLLLTPESGTNTTVDIDFNYILEAI